MVTESNEPVDQEKEPETVEESSAENLDESAGKTKEEGETKETTEKNGGHGVFCSVYLDWSLIGKVTLLTALAAAGFIIVKQLRK